MGRSELRLRRTEHSMLFAFIWGSGMYPSRRHFKPLKQHMGVLSAVPRLGNCELDRGQALWGDYRMACMDVLLLAVVDRSGSIITRSSSRYCEVIDDMQMQGLA